MFNISHIQIGMLCSLNPSLVGAFFRRRLILRRGVIFDANDDMDPYFAALGCLTLSVSSIEIINSLVVQSLLPPDVVILFINNSIKYIESVTDKYMQTRLVRLLCVFVQAQLRSKCIPANSVLVIVELPSFCLEFSRIKEAAMLYKALKQNT